MPQNASHIDEPKKEHPIIRNFAPGWYASVMGTAVLVLDFFVFRDFIPFSDFWQLFFLALSVIMFVLITIPWTLRWILYFDAVRTDLKHPVTAAFFPTMPISLIIIGLALEKAGPLFMSHETVYAIVQVLWILGTIGIGFFAMLTLITFFLNDDIEWKNANLGWLIPPVSALIVPVLGSGLAVHYANTPMGTVNILTSLIFLGIGGFLYLFVTATVFSRFIFHELPPSHLTPTVWIGIAPPAILTILAIKIVQPLILLFAASDSVAQVLSILAKTAAVSFWGFAFFWLILAIVFTLLQHQRARLSFATSWWAFTFPLGSFVVATGVVYAALHASFFAVVGLTSLVMFLIIWVTVSIITLRKVRSGAIFQKHGG